MAAGVVWFHPPSALAKAVGVYGTQALIAVKALADYFAVKMQNEMRQNAPWTDRTGRARGGLFCVTEAAASLVTIYLSHGYTVDYGVYLEFKNGGRFAIILPTIERNLPEINAMLGRLLRD